MYRVEVDWAPAYEMTLSLKAFADRPEHRTLELGRDWAPQVRSQLTPELSGTLTSREAIHGVNLMDLLIYQCEGDRDPMSFLDWLASLSDGDVYERLAPHVVERDFGLLQNLGALRDRVLRLLTDWNDQYFRHVDGAILDGLRTEAEERRAAISETSPDDLVELATSGIRVQPGPELDVVLLIPQYHYRPWNIHDTFRQMRVIEYPADVVPTPSGEPSPRLMRLARALSDESRLRILRFLVGGPATFTDVLRASGLSKGTVSHHMVALRAAGLVRVHDTDFKTLTYTLREDAIGELGERLREYLSCEL
jgi:DNA-binding transcriptional ArsR family regulator